MTCLQCDSLKEVETWNKPWSDEAISGPDAFQKLVYFGFKNDAHIYRCSHCNQAYLFISWNELFSDGWTEFSKLRKLTAEELNSYLPVTKPGL